MDWTAEQLELPPVLIENWLHKGHLGILTGSAKTNKSWSLLELAICHATGGKWMGQRRCEKATVLYIDAELQRPFWHRRVRWICEQQGLVYDEVMRERRIRPAFVAGKTPNAGDLQRELNRLFHNGTLSEYHLIIIDPIYQFYDDQWIENDNSDMAKLGKILRAIAEMTGISVVFAHHHTKGSQDGKRDIEKAAGGGSFGRFVAASVAVTLLDENTHKYSIGWTTSHFPPTPKVVAYREEFLWRVTDEDPNSKPTFTVDQKMSVLESRGATSEEWFEACADNFSGISFESFKTLRARARKDKRADINKSDQKWYPTQEELNQR